jgi:hypothetical protein
MEYSTILSSAGTLKKKSLYKITIAESTQELLYRINSAIMSAHDAGLSKTECKLPINFKQLDNNVSNREIQIAIYHNIVSELERKGYEPRIKIMKDYTLLVISWTVKAPDTEVEEMNRKLMSITM